MDVLASDTGYAGGPTIDAQPQNGTAQVVGSQIVYTPNSGFDGYDELTYSITDGENTAEATVGILVHPPTDTALDTADVSASTTTGTAVDVPVLDYDANYSGGIVSVGQPANGTATIDGPRILYTPAPGFTGTDTFDYTITDGAGNYATAPVGVTVQPVSVDIDINATRTLTDDVDVVGQTIPVLVTMHAPGTTGPQAIELRLSNPPVNGDYSPSSRAVFDGTSGTTLDLSLADGGSTTVWVRGTAPSNHPRDILVQAYYEPPLLQGNPPKVGEKPMEASSLEIGCFYKGQVTPNVITADSTTQRQFQLGQFHIPPRKGTAYYIQLHGKIAANRVVTVYVAGNSDANGKAELKDGGAWNGSDTITLKGTQFANDRDRWTGLIRGLTTAAGQVFQTQPGNANKVGVGASFGPAPAVKQPMVSFSVAANPTSVRITGAVKEQIVDTGVMTDAYDFAWGAKHTVQVVSDSGLTADLDKVGVMLLRFKLAGSSGVFVDSQARPFPVVAASQHNMVRSATYKQIPKAGNTEDQAKATAIQAFKDSIDNAIRAGTAQSILPYNGYYVFNDERTNPDGANVPVNWVPVLWDTLPNSGFWGQLSASKTGTTYNLKVEMSSRGTIKDQNGAVVATPGGATVSVPTTTVPLPPPPGF